MQFFKLAAILSTAALAAAANTMTFVSQDSIKRTIYWTANPGSAAIANTVVAGGASVTVNIPQGWQGNYYSVSDGQANVPGMLGEVAYNSWGGITFFDVSAIVNPNDKNGVKMIYPSGTKKSSLTNTVLVSGCEAFPCNDAYYHPDDVQTKATQSSDLITTLGTSATAARDLVNREDDAPVFTREWVMGKWTPKAA